MNDRIERIDRRRRRVHRTYLLGAIVFFASWMTRFILRELDALPEWLDWAVAAPFAAGLAIQIYSFFGLNRVRKEMAEDPGLKAALFDERARLNNLRAYKYGFFAMMGGLAFFAVFNFLSPIWDFFGVIVTLFLLGSLAYLLAFYRLERD